MKQFYTQPKGSQQLSFTDVTAFADFRDNLGPFLEESLHLFSWIPNSIEHQTERKQAIPRMRASGTKQKYAS
jgi:hypothetical protein